jgi:hypothetical protein
MIRSILEFLGFQITYVHRWGTWTHCYSAVDFAMDRPIHRNMSVAPPGAKMVISRR